MHKDFQVDGGFKDEEEKEGVERAGILPGAEPSPEVDLSRSSWACSSLAE